MATMVGAVSVVGLVVGLLVGLLLGVVLLALVGLLLGAAAGAAAVASARTNASTMALRGLDVRPADPEAHARLHNLTDGLCSTVGLSKPELLVLDAPAANAAAVGRSSTEASLVVTTGLLDALDRVELEGVLAHQLRRIRDEEALVATWAVPFAAAPAARVPALSARMAPLLVTVDDVFLDDRAAVDVTRYPPGLVGALSKVRDRGADVPGSNPLAAHLWLVPPRGGSVAEAPSLDDRIAALREL